MENCPTRRTNHLLLTLWGEGNGNRKRRQAIGTDCTLEYTTTATIGLQLCNGSKEVIIIGAGISGLGMAIQLKQLLGHDNFTIYEKSDNIGGTCHFYSYSFALKHDWTTMFPGRDELHQCNTTYSPHCRFNAMCVSLVWDNPCSLRICTFQDTISGETFKKEAPVVASAIGTLGRPYIPNIEGSESFQGEIFHSARWNDSFKPEGKKIVVLGNGASATQFVPELVKDVGPQGSVTQFTSLSRSTHGNPKYSERLKLVLKHVPFASKIRDATFSFIESDATPQYHEILKPRYEPECKRRVNTASYMACLHSPRMLLTDNSVVKVGLDYIETKSGDRDVADAIIYATGFQTQEWLSPMQIKGIDGKNLHQVWDAASGAEAYKGTVVSGFPNFFILYGPNAATGQHSVIFHSECQNNYSCRLFRPVLKGKADSIMVHDKLKHLVFNSGCQSWWMDPVTRENTFIYPDPMYKYWLRTIFPSWSDFEIRKDGKRHSSCGGMLSKGVFIMGLAAVTVTNSTDIQKLIWKASNWLLVNVHRS
ncbi:hypothetical protein BDV41DRAFT_589427 [Aspergillus transmontanensis]|uniref:L-ornithine N(5)-monooxygenase n=1 Tax=Aspergillus transmontanensis TaxID=1034304 RepID=A0A5N6VSU7_9EURO|nr:hypothetical protein BDV41DRAFT_589427 [Aspergillus transmontanensis]